VPTACARSSRCIEMATRAPVFGGVRFRLLAARMRQT
jgi:hypothetical protein